MDLHNDIGYLLHHLSFVLDRQSDVVLQERLGIGFSQFKIMTVLKWRPGTRQKEIAERLGQTEASISRQIKLMSEQGLLQTRLNPANRREHITVLTLRGEKLTDEAMRILNSYHQPVFGRLSSKQTAQLQDILGIMHACTCHSDRPGACHQAVQ